MVGSSEIQPYDLTSEKRFIPRRMLTLDGVNKEFARLARRSLVASLRRDIDFTSRPFEGGEFSEVVKRVPTCSNINVIRMSPLVGQALFVISANVVGILLNAIFGGTGRPSIKTSGTYTQIETRLIRVIVNNMLEELATAWGSVLPLGISLVKAEIAVQHAMIVAPTEVVVACPFDVKIGNDMGECLLLLPYPTIEPILGKLTARFTSIQQITNGDRTGVTEQQIRDCSVSVVADIGSAVLGMLELSRLSVGDVVMLDTCVSDSLELRLGGKAKFYGRPGLHRGNRAMQITSIVKD